MGNGLSARESPQDNRICRVRASGKGSRVCAVFHCDMCIPHFVISERPRSPAKELTRMLATATIIKSGEGYHVMQAIHRLAINALHLPGSPVDYYVVKAPHRLELHPRCFSGKQQFRLRLAEFLTN